ncbi:MAG: hypothetical protein U5L04_02240 [Trueperaceae bacterium]|nr:hypothetical protein [Trueperaceae bacterium]
MFAGFVFIDLDDFVLVLPLRDSATSGDFGGTGLELEITETSLIENLDEAQGFYLALPLAHTDFEVLLTARTDDTAPS